MEYQGRVRLFSSNNVVAGGMLETGAAGLADGADWVRVRVSNSRCEVGCEKAPVVAVMVVVVVVVGVDGTLGSADAPVALSRFE